MVNSEGRIVVIDNGSHSCRAGFADGGADPALSIRNIVLKPRRKLDNAAITLVGQPPPSALVGLETNRIPVKSAFDGNVVTNFEVQETVFDFVFDRISPAGDGCIDHEIVITECVLNPPFARQCMAELLFETYGCRAVHMGSDAGFAYAWNLGQGVAPRQATVVGMGHSSTHLIPIVDAVPDYSACRRIGVGGLGLTAHLQETLEIRHGKPVSNKDVPLSGFDFAERFKADLCYVSAQYGEALRAMQRAAAEDATRAHKREPGDGAPKGVTEVLPDFRMHTAVERIQIPEIYFQPSIAGIQQWGLTEACVKVAGYAAETHAGVGNFHDLLECVLLVGGGSGFRGIRERLAKELRAECREGASIGVVGGAGPSASILDAWRGAAAFARGEIKEGSAFADSVTRDEYAEEGRERLFVHKRKPVA